MKKIILISLFGLLAISNARSQETTKAFTGTYLSTDYLPTEDGEFVQVKFKSNDGKTIDFTEGADTFMASKDKTDMFTSKSGNGNNITNKLNAGKKYNLAYYINGNGVNIIQSAIPEGNTAQKKNPKDSIFQVVKKVQDGLALQNKCPNCAIDGAKAFIKNYITKIGAEKGAAETISFLELAIKENAFTAYYFTNTRASVVINKKFRDRYLGIQLKKESNKWIGLGIDDSWTSCKGLKSEDRVTEQQYMDCGVYLEKLVKKK